MKKTSILIIALSAGLSACAQKISSSQAPAVVINAFQQRYPKATDVEWEMKGSNYEVEFEAGVSGKDHKLLLDPSGKVLSHKQEIMRSELPAAVLQALAQQFPDYKTDDEEKIEANGTTSYKLEVKRKGEEWKLLFDADGKLLEKKAD